MPVFSKRINALPLHSYCGDSLESYVYYSSCINFLCRDQNAYRRIPKSAQASPGRLTLIENLIALAVVAVPIALAIKPVHQALSNAKANDEMGELPTIIANIQKVFANRANFGGATQELFVNQHVFPTDRVVPQTAELANRWGGAITTSVVTIGSSAPNNGIALTYEGVPSMECAAVIPQMDEIVRIISVNGTQVKADGQPADLDAVSTACNASHANEIVYQFSK